MRAARVALAAAAALLLLGHASSARAWVCTRAGGTGWQGTGASLSWAKRDLQYTFYADGTRLIPGDLELDVLRASFAVWSGVQACTPTDAGIANDDLTFSETDWMSYTDRIGYDFDHPSQNENLLIFRDGGWPIPGQTGVIALTTVTYNRVSGEILDADIEFDTADYPFSADASGSTTEMDLMNVAVHEIGHYLGLAHTTVPGTTMYPTGAYGETSKRTLACDDRDGIVFKYPAGAPNGYCAADPDASCGYCAAPEPLARTASITADSPDDGRGGCAQASPAPLASALVIVGLAGAVRRRR